jgi:hypothetical protein
MTNPIVKDYLNASVTLPPKKDSKSIKKRGQSIGNTQNYQYDERNESPTKLEDSPSLKNNY